MICGWGLWNSLVYGYFSQLFKINLCYDISECASPEKDKNENYKRSYSSS